MVERGCKLSNMTIIELLLKYVVPKTEGQHSRIGGKVAKERHISLVSDSEAFFFLLRDSFVAALQRSTNNPDTINSMCDASETARETVREQTGRRATLK